MHAVNFFIEDWPGYIHIYTYTFVYIYTHIFDFGANLSVNYHWLNCSSGIIILICILLFFSLFKKKKLFLISLAEHRQDVLLLFFKIHFTEKNAPQNAVLSTKLLSLCEERYGLQASFPPFPPFSFFPFPYFLPCFLQSTVGFFKFLWVYFIFFFSYC